MFTIEIVLPDLENAGAVVQREIRAALAEVALLLEAETKRATPVGATGTLRGSIASEVRDGPGLRDLQAVVGTPAKYGDVVERGRRPGRMPPPDQLELWVRRKLRVTGPRGGKRAPTQAEAKGIAWLIARKIARRGTEGAAMFYEAVEKSQGIIEQRLNAAGAAIVVQLNGD